MRRRSAAGAFALLLLLAPTDLASWMDRPASSVPLPEPLEVFHGTVGRRSNLGAALARLLPPSGIHQLVEAARPVYDLARISVGHPFDLALRPNGLLNAFSYGIDELRTLRVTRRRGGLAAEVLTRAYDVRIETARGVVASSLFAAVTESGESDQLALDLADIFAWDVDFNTELQPGDSFRLAVEKMYLDGRFSRYGKILSAEFLRGPRAFRAVRFEGEGQAGYYTPEGTPLRKAFLRSPLKFTRISSGFSWRRFHPILKTVRPHLGVDYAAPRGTPVMASGGGVVSLAGGATGWGNTVRIRHPNGYETLYGHLSRIHVRRGQRVEQGQLIGAVGSSGLSTGPHLDYRMLRDGAFLNPLTLQSPPAEPIPAAQHAAFEAERDRALSLLDGEAPAFPRTARISVSP